MLFSKQLPNGSHDFFQTFSIYFFDYFIKIPQTTIALPFLTHNNSAIGGVSRLCQKRPWLVGKRFFGLRACQGLRPCQKDQDHVREVETMSERSRPCQKRQWIAGKRFFGQLFTGKKG